ncbi:MAG: type II toxin-antitoxin system HicB family antitoxin [Synergistaceae bacterium]|nr:type II toxin-antitoxin system HicB family antitoxin [Synergistaceae bacterium]
MKYTIVIHKDSEEGGFWGECPELPGCDSQGDDVGELMSNTGEAVELFLESNNAA